MLARAGPWLYRNWTVLCGGLAALCNIELVVMPILLIFTDVRGTLFFIIAASCATIELSFWYFVPLSRIKQLAQAKIVTPIRHKPIIDELIYEFFERGFGSMIGLLVQWLHEAAGQISCLISGHLHGHMDEKSASQSRFFRWLVRGVRIGGYVFGYPAVFMLGAVTVPIPVLATIPWVSALVFCRSRKWHSGFFTLVLGNILKTYIYSVAVLAIST